MSSRAEKLHRIQDQVQCTCIKPRYLILNISRILHGRDPEYAGVDPEFTDCPVHGGPEPLTEEE